MGGRHLTPAGVALRPQAVGDVEPRPPDKLPRGWDTEQSKGALYTLGLGALSLSFQDK